jgi:hypothetical protein
MPARRLRKQPGLRSCRLRAAGLHYLRSTYMPARRLRKQPGLRSCRLRAAGLHYLRSTYMPARRLRKQPTLAIMLLMLPRAPLYLQKCTSCCEDQLRNYPNLCRQFKIIKKLVDTCREHLILKS